MYSYYNLGYRGVSVLDVIVRRLAYIDVSGPGIRVLDVKCTKR